jgi:hypothetical protein
MVRGATMSDIFKGFKYGFGAAFGIAAALGWLIIIHKVLESIG